MAKRVSTNSDTVGTDAVWTKLLAKAAKQTEGKVIFTKRVADAMLLGIPSPSLALSYGLGSNVIPLSRVMQLAGKTGSFKSAFAWDMVRIILEVCEQGADAGIPLIPESVQYNETENKAAPDFTRSILENRPQYDGIYCLEEPKFMDDWMCNMTRKAKEWESLFDTAKGGPGWVIPLCLVVDSLVAAAPREEFDKLLKEGSLGRGYPLSANLLSKWAAMMPGLIGNRPILFIATNHLKDDIATQPGMLLQHVPGGRAFQHMESLEFHMSKMKDTVSAKLTGAVVKIKFQKNCLGDSRRTIEVPIQWAYDLDEEGKKRQWTMWDWPKASIDLLTAIEIKRPDIHKKVQKVLDLNVSTGRVWSSALGIPKESKVSVHEAGCILEENSGILDVLLPILGIRQGRFFLPGMDFSTERLRESAQMDSMSRRVFRRPIANDLTRMIASQTGPDLGEDGDVGFEIDGPVDSIEDES